MDVNTRQLTEALTEFRTAVRPDGGRVEHGYQPGWIAYPEDMAITLMATLGRMWALRDDDEPDRCPECHMPLTMHHDPGCSQPCGRCEARKEADPELAAMAAIVAAMDELDDHAILLGTDVHKRVIRWAMARWNVRG